MTYIKKKTNIVNSKKKIHIVDDIAYKSSELVRYHNELKEAIKDNLINSFVLPQINDGQKKSKYGAYKAKIDDYVFDSVMEARFYVYLLKQQKDNIISKIERQVKFELQPSFINALGKKEVAINYIADFVIYVEDKPLVIDVKGKETADFKIKKKMFEYKYLDIPFVCVQWCTMTHDWEDLEHIKKMKRLKKKEAKLKDSILTDTNQKIKKAG